MQKYIGMDKSALPLITRGILYFSNELFILKITPVKRDKLRKDIRGKYDLCGDLLYDTIFPQIRITINQDLKVDKSFKYKGELIHIIINYDSAKQALQIFAFDALKASLL